MQNDSSLPTDMFHLLRKILPYSHPLRRWYSFFRGWIAAFRYGFPAKKIRVIGVTGTDGKTTTTNFIAEMLLDAGLRVGMISSATIRKGGKSWKNETKRTSLDPFFTQKFLRELVTEEYDAVILEVSSHALVQGRMAGIPFDIAVVTNLSQEHLDYHKTMEEYALAKRQLLENVVQFLPKPSIEKRIIINEDLLFFDRFASVAPKITLTFSSHDRQATVHAEQVRSMPNGSRFWLLVGGEQVEISLPIPGVFNVENALAAASVGVALHLPLEKIKHGLQSVHPIAGRMEEIIEGQNFRVFVDFALTPGAFEALLTSAREMVSGRVILLFGCAGGNHDHGKRPMLGEIAGRKADLSIVTEDENYGESFESIVADIKSGFVQTKGKYKVVQDRRKAIAKAFSEAKAGDIVLVTGMGLLPSRTMDDGTEVAWDERTICREELSKLLAKR